jgi:hypothetical protein
VDGVDTGDKHYGKGPLHKDRLTFMLGLDTAKLASLPDSVMARAKMVANRLSEIEEEGECSRKEKVRGLTTAQARIRALRTPLPAGERHCSRYEGFLTAVRTLRSKSPSADVCPPD